MDRKTLYAKPNKKRSHKKLIALGTVAALLTTAGAWAAVTPFTTSDQPNTINIISDMNTELGKLTGQLTTIGSAYQSEKAAHGSDVASANAYKYSVSSAAAAGDTATANAASAATSANNIQSKDYVVNSSGQVVPGSYTTSGGTVVSSTTN